MSRCYSPRLGEVAAHFAEVYAARTSGCRHVAGIANGLRLLAESEDELSATFARHGRPEWRNSAPPITSLRSTPS